jgi:hypothetical protein
MNLTILTNTIPPKKHYLIKVARFSKRLITRKRPLLDRYEGHPAVTRSLLMGLKNTGISFVYNPSSLDDITNTVLVLSDLEALRQAVALKKTGRIQKLFAGPNLVIDPSDERELLSSIELDGFLVNSDWVADFYKHEISSLSGKCRVWPSGVNMNEWTPKPSARSGKKVLIYDKLDHSQPLDQYQSYLKDQGWESTIIRYGFYRKNEYLRLLRESQFALFFSASESQGIALLESWAVDVPTIVWNRGWAFLKKSNKKIPASSAPYLNSQLGAFFSSFDSFKEAFQAIQGECLRPREWVCDRFSDEACAKNLLKILSA